MQLFPRGLVVLVLGMLCGCSGHQSAQKTGQATGAPPNAELVYETGTEVGVVRGGQVVARLPRHDQSPAHPAVVPLTKDGRFLYAVGDKAITVLDVRSLERREISCDSACRGSLKPLAPLGGSLIGGFDTSGLGGDRGTTAVKALDLAGTDSNPKSLGQVKLAFPHPVESEQVSDVQPYSFFLDAASGEYLFLDFAPKTPSNPRPWGQHQILHLARPDGTLLDLGEYSFPTAQAVWGAISPDGRQFVVGDWNYEEAANGSPDHCAKTGVDLFDASTGEKTVIAPPAEAPGPRDYTAVRSWWGRNGALYATFQQQPCVPVVPGGYTQEPPPMVWAYRDGQWSRVPTPGPAIQALDLGGGSLVVIQPAPPTKLGHTTEYDLSKGSLIINDSHGGQTHIADDVTAFAEIPPTGM